MKTLLQFILVLALCYTSSAQEKNIETESVAIENLINFMVEQYSSKTDTIPKRNITFLIETYADNFNTEDKVMLQQAFKIMSKRLTEEDFVSIVTYSKYNGIVLKQTEATNTKKLVYAVENFRSSINYIEDNGIELAYRLAKENFTEETENSVVMIRVPHTVDEVTVQKTKTNMTKANNTSNKKNNAVVLTAIALLPEIIKIIKD
ncbi:hypothetical protein [Winogradskyella sp. A2]|uniref:hypothetical protein n=1 Tax=Winogradskyella sp. A2 TaxID=3366944 RepID=UPI00398C3286